MKNDWNDTSYCLCLQVFEILYSLFLFIYTLVINLYSVTKLFLSMKKVYNYFYHSSKAYKSNLDLFFANYGGCLCVNY